MSAKRNKLANKARKQQAVRDEIERLRVEGNQTIVAAYVWTGNQYVRQVVRGHNLVEGVEPLPLTEKEQKSLSVIEEAYSFMNRQGDYPKPKDLTSVRSMLGQAHRAMKLEDEFRAMLREGLAKLEAS